MHNTLHSALMVRMGCGLYVSETYIVYADLSVSQSWRLGMGPASDQLAEASVSWVSASACLGLKDVYTCYKGYYGSGSPYSLGR